MILFVCTGNICRSPMAEGLLRSKLLASGTSFEIASAGTHGASSQEATELAVQALAAKGVDIGNHRSRQLSPSLIRQADLVVTMSRAQEAVVAASDQNARSRTFLAGEVVRLGGRVGIRRVEETVRVWAESLNATRGGHMTSGRLTDEVVDPYGHAEAVYRRVADRLDGICSALARLLAVETLD